MTPFANSIVQAMRRALTTLYPAGVNTWSGQPTKVTPVATLLTPGEHPAAEEINYLDNDRGERLTEARADMIQVQRRGEIASLRSTCGATEDIRAACVTASGKMFRHTAGTANAFARVVPGYDRSAAHIFGFVGAPNDSALNMSTVLCANGELVFRGGAAGGPPACWIYDATAGTFSAGIYLGGGTEMALDAIPAASGGGWVVLGTSDIAYSAFTVNLSAPRTFKATGIGAFTIRTVSTAGAIGADTASGALAAAEVSGGFAPGDTIRPHLIRGKASDIMFLVSGRALSKKYAAFSADDGATWTSVTLPDPFAAAPTPSTFTVEYCSITEAFVLIVDCFTATNVYNSTDGGATWTQLGATYYRAPAASWAVLTFGAYDLRRMSSGVLVALSHVAADLGGVLYSPLHVSDDGGVSWHLAEMVPLPGSGFHTLAMTSGPTMVVGGGSNPSRYGALLLGAQGA